MTRAPKYYDYNGIHTKISKSHFLHFLTKFSLEFRNGQINVGKMKKYIKITVFDKFLIRIAKLSSKCRIDEKVYQNHIFLINFPFF